MFIQEIIIPHLLLRFDNFMPVVIYKIRRCVMDGSGNNKFDSVKGQIGACGIWCGSCVAGNGVLQILTEKYREITEAYDLKQWAPKDFDYDEFSKGLQSIQSMPTCPGCLRGGGIPECTMRNCAAEKGVANCSRCSDQNCDHQETLEKMRSGAEKAGLFLDRGEDESPKNLIKRWTESLRETWPSSLLFP